MEEESLGRAELSTVVRLAYREVGPRSATPVLLLHAWGETRRCFDRLISNLPDTVHAVAVDQRGHGDSDAPQSGYALASMGEDIVGFMDAMGFSSAVLLGSSSGGYLAQQVAVTHPRRVPGLVLVGSPRSLHGRPSFADEVAQLTDPVDATWVRGSLAWFPRFQAVPQWFVEDRIHDGAGIPAHVWRETLTGLCAATPPTDAGTVTAPTIIIWGDGDELLTHGDQAHLARAIPGSRLLVYRDTGHLVLWEQPERLAADLTAFVDGLRQRRH
jgi:pimeloyl-ACP methyl ester carboxylesterase